MAAPRIDGQRLWASLQELAQLGAYTDERTGLRGVNRLALSDADAAGRALVTRWFREAGLEVRVDAIGNTYGRRRGRRADLAPVLAGSHIDSVPTGGAFDGALGVLGALEVVRTLNDARLDTERPLEIAFFTEEEGCRFGTDMLGSAVATGRVPLAQALGLRDRHGVSVGDELARLGLAGPADVALPPPRAYLECHIEQGPILAAAGVDVGVVTGVQAISWHEVTWAGASAHAGTTPMELRRDAGLAASRLNVELHAMARSGRHGAMRVTMGRIDPVPGLVNIIPGLVTCTVDLRNPDDAGMASAEAEFRALLARIEAEHQVTAQTRQTAKTSHVAFSEDVMAVVARQMDARGLSHQRILSGAGHDAQELARLCPTAMIFVPGEHQGISHNPREYSRPEACAAGVDVLLGAMLELAGV